MLYRPFATSFLLLLVLLLAALVVLVELRVLAYAYRKVGVRPRFVFLVLVLSLVGSYVNIPVVSIPVERLSAPHEIWLFGRTYFVPEVVQVGRTVIAVNVGGALIPVLVSLYLAVRTRMYGRMAIGVVLVAAIVHALADVVPGVGIVVPMVAPPMAAAAIALLLAFRRAPPVAYVSGSMGALIGADLLNLGRLDVLAAPVVAIGGAGTFDGVFLTGILAGLLA